VIPLNTILLQIKTVPALLIFIGVIGLAVIYLMYRKKEGGKNQAKRHLLLLDLEKKASDSQDMHLQETPPPAPDQALQVPKFETLQKKSWTLSDFYRLFLVILSFAVAAGFVLIVLSQLTVDKMTTDLRSTLGIAQEKKLNLLSLKGEAKGGDYHIAGEVQNISKKPINNLYAAIRFFSPGGESVTTDLVRMKNSIAPDEKAVFQFVYPNYQKEFSSYGVEFLLRQEGELVDFKDLRSKEPPQTQTIPK
jgi:hypothetical protein